MNIGLSLSGGGYRATVFHLGLLARLAESHVLENVTILSTVSGGSLCAGMLHGLNQMRWPTSQEYIEKIAPQAHHLLTTADLQRDLVSQTLTGLTRARESVQVWGHEKVFQDAVSRRTVRMSGLRDALWE